MANYKKFQYYWDNSEELLLDEQSDETRDIIELPIGIKNKLLEEKPKSLDELDLLIKPKL